LGISDSVNPESLLSILISGSFTTRFLVNYVNYLQNGITQNLKNQNNENPENANLIDAEIWLLEKLIQCCPIMTQEIIIILYSIFSFFFDFQSKECSVKPNKYGRKYKFPELDSFYLSVFFYKFENGKAKYIFQANDIFNEICFTSFDEIFSDNIKMSAEFLEFLDKKLLQPMIGISYLIKNFIDLAYTKYKLLALKKSNSPFYEMHLKGNRINHISKKKFFEHKYFQFLYEPTSNQLKIIDC
jgi:hypothetical protein